MKAEDLKNALEAYQTDYCEESVYKKLMLAFLHHHPQAAVLRSCPMGHFTASAWLLSRTLDQALMMHHTKLGIWVQLGGHCDGDWDVLRVAISEAQEETGITHIAPVHEGLFDLDVHTIPARAGEPAHYHYDLRFLLRVTSDEVPQPNHESTALRWVTTDPTTVPTTSAGIMRMHQKWCDAALTLPEGC